MGTKHAEGEFFIERRTGDRLHPWGVYQRLGGKDIRKTAFSTEQQARFYAAAQTICEIGSGIK